MRFSASSLYLIEILHQTTTHITVRINYTSCILLKFYIKPQQWCGSDCRIAVVSYWNSTSNHNWGINQASKARVVSYWNSTSNHNIASLYNIVFALYLIEILHQTTTPCPALFHCHTLYLIEILHQTTTRRRRSKNWRALYLIEILHQTTTQAMLCSNSARCILLKFYIKPQRCRVSYWILPVVSYWNSTSNHNYLRFG